MRKIQNVAFARRGLLVSLQRHSAQAGNAARRNQSLKRTGAGRNLAVGIRSSPPACAA